MNVILTGFKSSGKSSVGRALARLTGRAFLDSDAVSEGLYLKRHGQSLACREIFEKHGEAFMRELESGALRSLSGMSGTVLATGGGAVLAPGNIELLRSLGVCVFLDPPLAVLEKRLEAHAASPLFLHHSVEELFKQRRPAYLEAAHIHLPIDPELGVEDVARELARVISL